MLTFGQFAETWLLNREESGRYRLTTLVRDRALITHHIIPALGERDIREATSAEITAICTRLSREMNQRTGRPKAHTAQTVRWLLRKLLDDATAQGILTTNPARHLKLPAIPREDKRVFSLDEIERLLAAVRDDYKPFVLTAMLTGARFGEIRELRWKDIDLERGWIHIRRQRPTHEGQNIRAPKWDSVRTVELLDPVRQVLGSRSSVDDQALVFPAKGGGPIHPSHFRRHVWNPALLQSGMRMRPHEMRDVFVSLLIAFGEDIMRITRQTGHQNLAVFFRHYAHEIQRHSGTLSREETYKRFMAAFKTPADPERINFLSVNQAAKVLGVSWGWLFELLRRGTIPATRRGHWLIPRDALTNIRLPRSRRRYESPSEEKG